MHSANSLQILKQYKEQITNKLTHMISEHKTNYEELFEQDFVVQNLAIYHAAVMHTREMRILITHSKKLIRE